MRLQPFVAFVCVSTISSVLADEFVLVDDFGRSDSLYHGHGWETLNPGYWKIENDALRRRLKNNGNRNPITRFPWHWSSGGQKVEPHTGDRTPNFPMGMIWREDWTLSGNYTLRATFTVRDLNPEGRGEPTGFMGICFGGESLYESRSFEGAEPGAASWMALWYKDERFGLFDHREGSEPVHEDSSSSGWPVPVGVEVVMKVRVLGDDPDKAMLVVSLEKRGKLESITIKDVDRKKYTDGFFGLVAYGALDFEVNRFEIEPGDNTAAQLAVNELHVCYPLGDTLKQIDGRRRCAAGESGGEDALLHGMEGWRRRNGGPTTG